jgi:hypothetical protein
MKHGAAGLALVAALWGACRHGGAGATREARVAPPPGDVRGRVVNRRTGAGLAGRIVIAAGRRTTTASDGSFTLPDLPDLYDLTIADAGGERASVYQKLSRRDPLLVHDASGPPDEWRGRNSARVYATATVDGHPSAAAPLLLGFFSPEAAGEGDPVVLHWNGPPSLEGELLAVALDEGGRRAWGARRRLTVGRSTAPTIDLPLAAMPRRRVRGALAAPPGFQVSSVIESFRLPLPGADLRVRSDERDGIRALDDDLPDAGALGANLCVTVAADGEGTSGATRCAAAADGTFAFALDRPPALSAPAQGAPFEPDTVFSWSGASAGVQVLQLAGAGPAADRPDVTIYTPDRAVSWQELAGIPVRFPRACSIYQVTAGGRGPYASMDEAVAPGGLGAWLPAESRWTQSSPITVTVPRWPRPQPGSFEAKLCHYPAGQGIVCGAPTRANHLGEFYVLSAINNHLRNFPEFAKSVGIYCVHDCESARLYMKALREYRAVHPDFDAREPLDTEDC